MLRGGDLFMKNVIIFILLLFLLIFVGCKEKTSKTNSTKKIVLTLAIQDVPNSPPYDGYLAFADKLEQLSGGMMSVEFIQMTKYGTITDMFNTMVVGAFDMVATPYHTISNVIPEIEIMGVPYLVRDYDHFTKIQKSNYGKQITTELNNIGVIASSFWNAGLRQTTSNTPINSSADFKGLKFRTSSSPSIVIFVENMGANAIDVSFSELYTALKSELVEAQENPIPVVEVKNLYEVQKYIALTDHLLNVIGIFINKYEYDSFTEQQKEWYNEAVKHGAQICHTHTHRQETRLLEKYEKEYGMTITYPNKNELRGSLKSYLEHLEKQFDNVSISEITSL